MTGALLFLGLGIVAGAVQGELLWRATARPAPLWLLLRYALAAGALVLAALAGHVLSCALGWGAAFAAAVAVHTFRGRR